MSKHNIDIIRGMYDSFARGDVPSVLEAMDPAIEWNEAENFPYADGNPYVGPTAVVEGVFKRLGDEWENWSITTGEVLEAANDAVVVLGRYRAKYKKTAGPLDAQFAHVWWLRNGKVVKFQQFTDTEQVAKAVRGASAPESAASEATAAIDSLYDELVAAVAAGSAEGYAAAYDQDGAVLPPNVPAVLGRAAIETWATQFFATWEVAIDSLSFEDRRIGNTVGFARYRMIGRGVPKTGGPEIELDQKYVDTFVKDSTGSWRLATHMVNTNSKGPSMWD